jgi:hypothetical protein
MGVTELTNAQSFTPDCGHPVSPAPGDIGTGYATSAKTGKTMCYPCADASEREAIKTADVFVAYVSADRKRITTWTGGELAEVTSHVLGKKIRTSEGWYRVRAVTAVTPDGAEWYGRGSDNADVITIRRKKGSK